MKPNATASAWRSWRNCCEPVSSRVRGFRLSFAALNGSRTAPAGIRTTSPARLRVAIRRCTASRTSSKRKALRCLFRGMRGLRKCELAFLGDSLERFRRAFDPVLAIIAVARQLADNLIGATRRRTRNIARSEVHGRSNREFVLQRPLHHTTYSGL